MKRIGKITTQQAKTNQVNKVKRYLLEVPVSIQILEFITWTQFKYKSFTLTVIKGLHKMMPRINY